jgi:hypothetical protein
MPGEFENSTTIGDLLDSQTERFVDRDGLTVTGKIQKFRMREMAIEELGLQKAAGIETA